MSKQEQLFTEIVWQYYTKHGRKHLPWRKKKHQKPYNILVSEVMLQQTQVERVIPKYEAFIARWPHANALAEASLSEVLIMWQGLGYNSRAKRLRDCAREVVRERRGRWPQTYEELCALPGIGPYTAGAVMVFAYNKAAVLIETNIRSVYIHHFFKKHSVVDDKDIAAKVKRTLPTEDFRNWYAALMDYGVHIKKTKGNHAAKSAQFKKQTPFKGSDREIRGALINALRKAPRTVNTLRSLPFQSERINEQLTRLEQDGLLQKTGQSYHLPTE